jgi:hypothetical protein
VRKPSAGTVAIAALAGGLACGHRATLVAGDGGADADGAVTDADLDRNDGAAPDTGEVQPAFDPGFVGMRRLSDAEYARTVQDLLGLAGLDATIMASFADADRLAGRRDVFDNGNGQALMSSGRFETYFRNAATLTASAFASQTLRARIVTCTPPDDACATSILRSFGLRAWRRPLTEAELADLAALVRSEVAAGDDFTDAIREAVVALLASESFLYRIELDPSSDVRPLTSYELASRLSYLLWSTMPDDALFALAASDGLRGPEVLSAQVSRMLADARSDGFVRNFFGQWLGFRVIMGPPIFRGAPGWSPELQASMAEEARLFVSELVHGDRPVSELLTADVNFIDWRLNAIYDPLKANGNAGFTRTNITTDERVGYLGLAAFLTGASEGPEASRFPRGLAVDERILCLPPPEPPAELPPVLPGTPREQWEAVAAQPSCGPCHETFEPLGLGFENFDEIGRYRANDPASQKPIDPTGALPDGTPFRGETGLAALLGADPRFAACARREALVYALGRPLTDGDARSVAAIDARWHAAGDTVKGLLAAIVVDDLFRQRRGERP